MARKEGNGSEGERSEEGRGEDRRGWEGKRLISGSGSIQTVVTDTVHLKHRCAAYMCPHL